MYEVMDEDKKCFQRGTSATLLSLAGLNVFVKVLVGTGKPPCLKLA